MNSNLYSSTKKVYNKIMKNNPIPEGINALTYILAVSQTNEVFQIIELVCSIVTSVLLISFRLWKWYKEAKKDGKIDKEEIQEAIDIITDEDNKKKGE